MIRIHQIKLELSNSENLLKKKISKILKITENDIKNIKIKKISYDCRKKPLIFKVFTVDVIVKGENSVLKRCKSNQVVRVEDKKYHVPKINNLNINNRPVVVGMGPSGLFCSHILALNGFKPIIIEQGEKVEDRIKSVNKFWENGKLNTKSNVQFGEGGAGTFSDGKMQTGINDIRMQYILEKFVEFGADKSILIDAKPHVGSDRLRKVLVNFRNHLLELGCSIYYNSEVTDINIVDRQVKSIEINNGEKFFETDICILGIGHSARNTFRKLNNIGIPMESKSFAIGLRIEHPQKWIDENKYGKIYKEENLPSADYKLVFHGDENRSCYSFCMCPGGYVVGASSEKNRLVVNGMSDFKRDSQNANSALIVPVKKSEEIFGGMDLQIEIEEKAFLAGGENYFAPVQRVSDFLNKRTGGESKIVKPSYMPGIKWVNLWDVLPQNICESIKMAIIEFDKKISKFSCDEAILTGVETRSSSPIRILRNEKRESEIKGIYPIGEGAGYAGGITSSAIDGLKTGEEIINKFRG